MLGLACCSISSVPTTVVGVGAWKPSRIMREAETVTCSVSCAAAGLHRAGAQDNSAATLVMVSDLLLTRRRRMCVDMPPQCVTCVMIAFPRFYRGNPAPMLHCWQHF